MRKRWLWVAGTLGVLIALAYAVAFLIDEPLRRYMEREMNSRLAGYAVRISDLDVHPLGFSVDLNGLTIVQMAKPDPPVAHLPKLGASVHWRALLHGRVVADFKFHRPRVYINLAHVRKEAADEVLLAERGWQKALEAAYFDLKINKLEVSDGDVTYVDEGQFKPLQITRLNVLAENIRNVRSKDREYPSDIRVNGIVFGRGKVWFAGHADFLAEPHAGTSGKFKLEQVELDYFKPIAGRYNVSVKNGVLSAVGNFEYAPRIKTAQLENVTVRGVQVEYVHTPRTAEAEKVVATKVAQTAKKVSNHPEIQLRIDRLDVVVSEFAFVDKASTPAYRIFLANTDLSLTNLSNQGTEGVAEAKLRGKFMGTGETLANATFRPEEKGANFDLKLRVENTDAVSLNDLLRARGNFDVVAGQFSIFSELSVKDGEVSGYVKPLFRNLSVYDARQDRDKAIHRKIYEALVGALAALLENRSRDEVATKVMVSGRVDDPRTSGWEIAARLIQNAFFREISHGFDRITPGKSR